MNLLQSTSLTVVIAITAFFSGCQYNKSSHNTEEELLKQKIAQLTQQSKQVTTQVETVYKDKIIYIDKIKTQVITQYVPQFISTQANDSCIIPNGFVRLHDSAADNQIPGTASTTDAAPSEVDLIATTKVITSNYYTCHATTEQLLALQDWITKQKQLQNEK